MVLLNEEEDSISYLIFSCFLSSFNLRGLTKAKMPAQNGRSAFNTYNTVQSDTTHTHQKLRKFIGKSGKKISGHTAF